MPNRLISEKSPYLLQHAQNPVDWYPWGEDAFARAIQEDKPIFLSIGYSTCHWCHVMERESFEDEAVAALFNETFVNIKVDREERPDIDAVYMQVCRMMTQTGGWPLSIMMTPDKKPFFAATYIPRETKYGRVGLTEMIPQVRHLWRERRSEVLSAAAEITAVLQRPPSGGREEELGEEILHQAYQSLASAFDRTYGGFGQAPKFPSPHQFLFLLRYWRRTGENQALAMVEQTIKNMRRGGIYDHIGFGFHRYSTDERWIVPHFEKMLYDQALMAMACIELYQATGKQDYENTAREIFTYVLQDMTDHQGGFYSAEDADSEGLEGKFYLWTESEVQATLNREDADLFLSLFSHDDSDLPGMAEMPEGHFIPHRKAASASDRDEGVDRRKLEGLRRALLDHRKRRIRPHLDDKILVDSNGLMIAALALGAQVFSDQSYLDAARRAADFIEGNMKTPQGRLLHRFRDGEAAISATVDDYAFYIWGLCELYEATFETRYLKKALEYQTHLYAYFRDEKRGGYYLTAADAEALLIRPKELYDGATPSGNSAAFCTTLRLSRMTGDLALDEQARAIYKALCGPAKTTPQAFTYFLCGLDFAIGPAHEVVIAGERGVQDTEDLLRALRRIYAPNKTVIFRPSDESALDVETISPFVADMDKRNGRATAYVCSHFACGEPTNDPGKIEALLGLKKE